LQQHHKVCEKQFKQVVIKRPKEHAQTYRDKKDSLKTSRGKGWDIAKALSLCELCPTPEQAINKSQEHHATENEKAVGFLPGPP